MRAFKLRLFEDRVPGGYAPIFLPRAPRSIYTLEGEVTIEFDEGSQWLPPRLAWVGDDQIAITVGKEPAKLLRWELVDAESAAPGLFRSAPAASSELKLEQVVELDPGFDWIMRCDRVGFPPGGIAYTHVHQGPGIRYTVSGEITIETQGRRESHPAGDAWFELGPAPVLAPTTERSPTVFVRCFLLPRQLRGRSSIRYVKAEDAAKPKPQDYHVFADRLLRLW